MAHFAAGNLMSAACLLTYQRRADDPVFWMVGSGLIRRQRDRQRRFDSIHSIVKTAWAWHRQNPRGYTFKTLPLCMNPSPAAQLSN